MRRSLEAPRKPRSSLQQTTRVAVRSSVLCTTLMVAGAVLATAQGLPDSLQRAFPLLQPAQRAAIEGHLRAWLSWSPAAQAAFDARLASWDALPLHERRQRRESWVAWQQLSDDERARLRTVAAQVATLDGASRAALRAGFDALDVSTQRGWMLGPALGADYARLQPLLAQAPAPDHAPLLRTLRAMTAVERSKLGVLVQRTPPQERERLRRDLVSTSDINRAAWLELRLQR